MKKKKISKALLKYMKYFLIVIVLGISLVAIFVTKYIKQNNIIEDTSNFQRQLKYNYSEKFPNTYIYDDKGQLLSYDTEKPYLDYIKLKDVPQLYKTALIDTENKNFFTEKGVSVKGIVKAGVSVFQSKILKKQVELVGGSTIDQQLVKNFYFSTNDKDKTIDRKFKEIIMSYTMNQHFTKNDILEKYINIVYYNENAIGTNSISEIYFGKKLSELTDRSPQTIAKIAYLSGLNQNPTAYNLYTHPKAANERKDIVLGILLANKKIDKKEYNSAKKISIEKLAQPRFSFTQKIAENKQKYRGYINVINSESKDYINGNDAKQAIKIYSYFNKAQQDKAQSIVDNNTTYQDNEQQLAASITRDNNILVASVAGRSNSKDYLDRANQNTRSSGSSMKPIIDYAPLFDKTNLPTNTTFSSSRFPYDANSYADNYGGYTYGNVTLNTALQLSLNTPVLRFFTQYLNVDTIKNTLENMDIHAQKTYDITNTLGVNVSTLNQASAYRTLANLGKYTPVKSIQRITANDKEIYNVTANQTSKTIYNPSSAYVTLRLMEGTTQSNMSAPQAALQLTGYAVKTGSVAYDQRVFGYDVPGGSDSWTAATTKHFTASVWTGYDKPNQAGHWINDNTDTAQYVVKDLISQFSNGSDTSQWAQPNNVKTIYDAGVNSQFAITGAPSQPKLNKTVNIDISSIDNNPLKVIKSLNEIPKTTYNYSKSDYKEILNATSNKSDSDAYNEIKELLPAEGKFTGNIDDNTIDKLKSLKIIK
ncbi:transglycosylase domain-containing protein [Lactococcus insecticola]|uniref:Penicillin-binding protein 1A n=1 Tax=Pseudolactococcus insecticola TaxID=2709158 RepID=A0A6A0B9A6_9LACT|nr:transglycosylase domain-containing protein [Lactococcus insecticola]GFH41396.1 penicillin-binding protein 1A [Lactococcus insecticola]